MIDVAGEANPRDDQSNALNRGMRTSYNGEDREGKGDPTRNR
jgi:hypothetical protein